VKIRPAPGIGNVGGIGGDDDASSPAPGAASPPSQSTRKPSTASNTFSTRSFEFAPDRSPLQKLELELKHISREETDAPQLGRSLSKKQTERLQRSTTITSRITNPRDLPLGSRRHPKIGEHTGHHPDSGTGHRHLQKISDMLGHHHHLRHKNGPAENTDDTPSGVDEPQAARGISKKPVATVPGHGGVGSKEVRRHRQHGSQFQPAGRRSTSSSGSDAARITQARGGEGVFDPRIVRLTLEDAELDGGALRGTGDAAEDSDGMTNSFYQDRISCLSSPAVSFLDGAQVAPMPCVRALQPQPSSTESMAKGLPHDNGYCGTTATAFSSNSFEPGLHDLSLSPQNFLSVDCPTALACLLQWSICPKYLMYHRPKGKGI
jgi:hypothetical protein